MPLDRLVPVAEAADPSAARIYAALLMSSGIPVQLHGDALGPYAVTVGRWAVTTLWVPESDRDDAVELLRAENLEPALTIVDVPPDRKPLSRTVVVATIGGLALAVVVIWLLAAL